jgi:membrane protease YdiL (CAAX protease family)
VRDIAAGPLILARNAALQHDRQAELAALRPGAQAGWRITAVNSGVFLFGGIVLLGAVLMLVILHRRIFNAAQDARCTHGNEVPWGIGTGLIVISLSFFCMSLIGSGLQMLVPTPNPDVSLLMDLLATLLGPLLVISLFLLALGRKPWEWGVFGWQPTRRGMRYGFSALLLTLPFVIGAGILTSILFSAEDYTHPLIPRLFTSAHPLMTVTMLLTAVVVAPLVEETLFRGILFRAADVRFPLWIAVLGSGLFFAVGHRSLTAMLPITVLGSLFAFLTRRSQSLLASAAAHAGYNGITTLIVLLTAWALRGSG